MHLHLSANSRLTRYLKAEFAQQSRAGVTETPDIMTWSGWWQTWSQAVLLSGELPIEAWPQRVISRFEAMAKWEALLETHSPTPLLNLAATAQSLYQAWCLALEYGGLTQADASEENQLFHTCAQAYQAWLVQHQWLDEVLWQQRCVHWFEQGVGACPSQVSVYGFDDFSPFMRAFLDAVLARGGRFETQSRAVVQPVSPSVYAAKDPRDELQQVAGFCVSTLQDLVAQGRKLGDIRIGVVAPDLQTIKSALPFWLDDQLFQHFAEPLLAHDSSDRLYNLSLGQPLTELALIQYALLSLRLMFNPNQAWSYNDWSPWLVSPFNVGELTLRQALDRDLRRLQWAWIKWPTLASQTEQLRWPSALQKQLQQMADLALQPSYDLAGFVEQVERALAAINWLQLSNLSSELYQQRDSFNQALAQFAGYRGLQGKRRLNEWLMLLQRHCSQTLYQAQSERAQPIQIMGMLEAGGQLFDALWVIGLDDEAWPRPAQPNPFLPLAWQRQAGLPRCDAQRELDYASQLTARLCASSSRVVLSYARQKGDAVSMPSPLLRATSDNYLAQPYRALMQQDWLQHVPMDWVDDSQAPEVVLASKVPGGTGILTAHAKCPLMAFMDYRLGAKYQLEEVEDGLASTDQGKILHAVLQHFWQRLENQSALHTLSDEGLASVLIELVDSEFSTIEKHFSADYLAIEKARLLALLHDWMALEKARPLDFKVVGLEQTQLLTLAGIQFQTTIDRIDQTAEGLVLIDYKTGKASVNDLLTEPLRAPQLAVYLHAFHDQPVQGLGYGLLSSDQGVGWNLLAADEGLTEKGSKLWSKLAEKGDWQDWPWDGFLQYLRDEVEKLAAEIQQGYAPMRYQKLQDTDYAACKLALRLPEVRSQLADWENDEVTD